MPPKESIREIRINQNPFSAENEQASGRIEILTRPGTDKLRGSSFFNFEDESLNSRNPFSSSRTPFQVRNFGGNLGGPIVKKKASFFVDFDRRETDDNELVNARTLDENLNPVDQGFRRCRAPPEPEFQSRASTTNSIQTTLSLRVTAITAPKQKTLAWPVFLFRSVATTYFPPRRASRLTETAILNASMVNETRFQYSRNRNESLGDNTIPVLNVSGAFISGGSQVGHAFST